MCLRCWDLDHLTFLPSADRALTRRSVQAGRPVVVVDWWNPRPVSRSRRGYRPPGDRRERLGVLVETSALESAAGRCLADASALADRRAGDARRAARGGTPWDETADVIRERYPGCPRADVIAYYAALVGPDALDRIVANSVRYVDGVGDDVGVAAVLDAWRAGVVPLDD